MGLTLAAAAKLVGRDKTTLLRAVRKGRISASRSDEGIWLIDESELRRVYPEGDVAPERAPVHAAGDAPDSSEAIRQMNARLADAHDTIRDLRTRLDHAEQRTEDARRDLDAAQAKLTALLTDQRPDKRRKSWLPWRR